MAPILGDSISISLETGEGRVKGETHLLLPELPALVALASAGFGASQGQTICLCDQKAQPRVSLSGLRCSECSR